MNDLQVIGPTLTLRYARQEDAPALFKLGSNEDVTRFLSWGPYTSLDQPAAYINALVGKRERGELLEFLVVHREAGPIGVTGLSEFVIRDRRATVGTWFGRDWWGTGANFESKALVAALGFEVLGLDRITSTANITNGRSQVAQERIGFKREGVLRKWNRHGDVSHDVIIFGMLRSDWEASPLFDVPVIFEGEPPSSVVAA